VFLFFTMMRGFCCISFILFVSCQSPVKESSTPIRRGDPGQDSSLNKNTIEATKDLVFIGKVGFFKETGEFYTSLSFKNPDYSEPFEKLQLKTDSLIFQDEERKRKRLPLSLAREFFALANMDSLELYDANQNHLSQAVLVRTELREDVIEGEFVAVYRTMQPLEKPEVVLYGVSSFNSEVFTEVKTQPHSDSVFSRKLIKAFDLFPDSVIDVQHIKLLPSEDIYSVIVMVGKCLLTGYQDGKFVLLKTINDDYYIYDIAPTGFSVNHKPVFLAELAVHETDAFWSGVLYFDGKEFQFADSRKIEREMFDRR
jgi:hypothetical protein